MNSGHFRQKVRKEEAGANQVPSWVGRKRDCLYYIWEHKLDNGMSGTEPLGGTSSRCLPMTSYVRLIRNTDKQFLEYCSNFGGIFTGTQTYHYVQDYNGLPPGISTTDTWGLNSALRRQLLVYRS